MSKFSFVLALVMISTLGCDPETSPTPTSSSSASGSTGTGGGGGAGGMGGGGSTSSATSTGTGGRPESCSGSHDGALCWGEAKDRIHGECRSEQCIVTEWGCHVDNDCNDDNECTSDACEATTGQCIHGDYPRTHTCSAPGNGGHCNPVDGSCCDVGFVEDSALPGWFLCVQACPFKFSPRPSDGFCIAD